MADSIECNEASNLDKQQFRLNKINEIKDYFIVEIKERELMSKRLVMLARSTLNSMKSKMSESLMNNQISHKDFMTIINEERNYRELKESIRMMKDQEDKKIDID